MAFNIDIAQNPSFSTGNGAQNPIIQEWTFNTPVAAITHQIGSEDPAVTDIEIMVKNYASSSVWDGFENFTVSHTASSINADVPFFALQGDIQDAPDGALAIAGLDTIAMRVTAVNLGLFQESIYDGVVSFTVRAEALGSGVPEIVDRFTLPVQLVVGSGSRSFVENTTLFFSHVRDTALPQAQVVDLGLEPFFRVELPLSFRSTPGAFVGIEDGRRIYAFNSVLITNFSVSPGPEINDQALEEQFYNARVIQDNSGEVIDFGLRVLVQDEGGVLVTPEIIEWNEIKGFPAPSAIVDIRGAGAFTITAPDWIQLSASQGVNELALVVSSVALENFAAGVYTGTLRVDFQDANEERIVEIRLTVVETINNPYTSEGFNFSNDLKFIDFYNVGENLILEADYVIRSYDYEFGVAPQQFSFSESYPFFNRKASVHLGQVAQRYFQKMTVPLLPQGTAFNEPGQIQSYYKPLEMFVVFRIVSRNNGQVLFNEDLGRLEWVSGRRPLSSGLQGGALFFKPAPRRLTKNSLLLFNYFQKGVIASLLVRRNNNLIGNGAFATFNNNLFGMYYRAAELEQGDVLDISTSSSASFNSVGVQRYVVVPEGKQSNHIIWVNEYGVCDILEFTGEFTFGTSHEATDFLKYTNLVEIIERLDFTQENSLTINTGWVFKGDQFYINELARAPKAWFVKGNRFIELVPNDVTLVNEDSADALYSYDMSFTINKKNELENHTSLI